MIYRQKQLDYANGVFCTLDELFYEGQKAKGYNIHFRRKSRALRSGGKRSSIRGRGMEFFESRPYVPQDEKRNIDWKVSARLNGLFTKIFVEERDRPTYIVVDMRSSMFFGSVNCFKSVMAARLSARLAAAVINGGDNLGGFVFTDNEELDCSIRGGRKNLARFFSMLSEGTKNYNKSFSYNSALWPTILKIIINRIHAGTAIFLISDFLGFDEHAYRMLFNLRRKADIFALPIFDPLEENLPSLGVVGVAFGDEKIVFDSDNKRLRKKYLLWRNEQKNTLDGMFSALDIPKVSFSTADDLDISTKQIFAGRW